MNEIWTHWKFGIMLSRWCKKEAVVYIVNEVQFATYKWFPGFSQSPSIGFERSKFFTYTPWVNLCSFFHNSIKKACFLGYSAVSNVFPWVSWQRHIRFQVCLCPVFGVACDDFGVVIAWVWKGVRYSQDSRIPKGFSAWNFPEKNVCRKGRRFAVPHQLMPWKNSFNFQCDLQSPLLLEERLEPENRPERKRIDATHTSSFSWTTSSI